MDLVDDCHVWILPEMDLNDIRRVAEKFNTCDVHALLKNTLMVGQRYITTSASQHLKVAIIAIAICISKRLSLTI